MTELNAKFSESKYLVLCTDCIIVNALMIVAQLNERMQPKIREFGQF